MSFELPKLDYTFDALEPYIDAETMRIHYEKHHNAYVTNLNAAIANTDLEGKSIEYVMQNIPQSNSNAIRNNGGGHYNHTLFWSVISNEGNTEPVGDVKDAITSTFGSFESFKEEFSKAAMTRFGSGWAWLCVHKGGGLSVCSTPNQDNPLMNLEGISCCNSATPSCDGTPILGLDVWEHAYYLKYQNRRLEYVSAFFNIIDWKKVSDRYNSGK
ncbi:superoxide dismutase [Ichthyobacterium seriolicida]|uniref:Superoxide dismutase n=1 Tax=Ichthyobacterium seriolicida TaxID=242600 RepID=A0A1J1E961_9FLAO|nr:superoxide dismutase [Ichthyobacterium seriolicida]BAV94064.1 manganese superoxide dismutase [Ichthyobacterium seriolicida]